jgi:hypothetical protein
MAGDWIKFDASTPEKPEVLGITVTMGWDDPDLTVGKLLRVWRWFDQQTLDGNAESVSLALLNRIAGVSGFAEAMVKFNWLVVTESGISLPNFHKHNGKTAKTRCQTAKRVANLKTNAETNAASVSKALPREEKRREDSSAVAQTVKFDIRAELKSCGVDDRVAEDWIKHRKTKGASVTETVLKAHISEAGKASLPLGKALAYACVAGWQGFRADWYFNREGKTGGVNGHAQDDITAGWK